MFLARLAVDRPVLATVIILALVVVGVFSYTKLAQELRPNVDFPFVVVTTIYPGAGPKEVESQVTEKLEDEIGSVAGLKKMESQSMENLSMILCEFDLEIDGDMAAIEVKDKVELAKIRMPRNIEPPVVQQFSFGSMPILNVALNSDRPLRDITLIADTRVADELSRIDGVSKVEVVGGLEREINIACHADKLRSYGLSIMDVVGFIQAENINFPSGHITGLSSEYSLRMVGEFTKLDQLRKMKLITPEGVTIQLQDVADVLDLYEEPREQARFQGKPAVSIKVQKKNDANTVLTSAQIHKVIEKDLQKYFDQEKITAYIANDSADYIKDSIQDVLTNIVIGILLTSILLYLFLHDFRSTIIVAVSMPASVIATFTLMYSAGFTINIISMMGLGISVGILVTNSIVVLENISNKLAIGLDSRSAAIEGTSEIAIAVVASTLTNLVVFSPIAFMKGIIGRFMLQFGLTVVFATMISLLISFTLTPMLAAKLLSKPKKKISNEDAGILVAFGNAWDRFYDRLALDYKALLGKALNHRLIVVAMTIVVFLGGMFLFGFIGGEFFPEGDVGLIRIIAKLPAGTNLKQTDRTLRLIEQTIKGIPEVETVLAEIGGEGKGVADGQITLNMVAIEKRKRSTAELVEVIRPMLASIPAAEIQVSARPCKWLESKTV